jgi:hypothetical protein
MKIVRARFQALTAASMKMSASWDIAPCSLVEVYRRFRGAYCLLALIIEAHTSETSVYFNKITRRCIPEGSHLQNSSCLTD